MEEMTQTLIAIVGAMGGWELVKWLLTRRANKAIASASADQAEIQTEEAEFVYLRKRIEFSEQQMAEKERRFAEQTDVLRQAQRDLVEAHIECGQLKARVAALEAERAMKLCERKGCGQRQPQSGY
jgi:cell division protein FtsB